MKKILALLALVVLVSTSVASARGLRLSVAMPNGVVVSHWKIDALRINYRERKASVVVSGYLTKTDFNAGKKPVTTKQFSFIDTAFPYTEGASENITNITYDKLALDPYFAAATSD